MKKNVLLLIMIFAIQFAFSQNYLISFAASGASNYIDSVSVENLSQGTNVMLNPGDSLLLIGTIGIIEQFNSVDMLQIFPNPMSNKTTLSFVAKQAGNTSVTIYNASGNKITGINEFLPKGLHQYQVSGLPKGAYIIYVTGNLFDYSSKLICQSNTQSNVRINYVSDKGNRNTNLKNGTQHKQSKSIVNMDYTYSDQLLFKGYSYNYTTLVADVPTESKTISFEFVECVDYDGNHYPVVQIGEQLWMAESLKTTHYRNGSPIPNVIDNDEWTELETGAYCWYDNDISHKAVYGALYNWYTAIDDNNIAPVGWHVPTKEEIITLTNASPGGYSHNGGKLKETGNEHWINPNVGATNETGFTALPGGHRLNDDGLFYEIGLGSYFSWSSTEDWGQNAWYSAVESVNDRAYLYGYWRKCGFSIRCVRD